MTSTQWLEYHIGTKRKSYNSLPTSDITAEAVSVNGFTLSQTDNAGVTTTNGHCYTAQGMIQTQTDSRNNTTTTVTDIAGRTLTVTDAAGNVTTTVYGSAHDLPATVTDAQGNTSCYRYDARGRKLAEWGTGIQPVCFGYDDADRMTSLTTFRASAETVSTDPSYRTDRDTTTWSYHDTSGMETAKTYADNSSVAKTYDAYNRVLTETDARGKVKAHTYEQERGLLLGTTYSDSTTPRAYTYNHLGQRTQVTDAAGVRTLSYNSYGEQESDSLVADSVTHLITETRDEKGRSTGYTYAKNGTVQQTVTTGYGSDGRISSAGFTHGGAVKQFGYQYLSGTNLLYKLTKPNNMTLTQTYEATRDLLTDMVYHRGSTLVAQRTYTYDILGRPTARNTARQGTVVNDTFAHNSRAELVQSQVNGKDYRYAFDNIGNRQTSVEDANSVMYDTNELNQYTAITENGATAFMPQFDADGNQTLIKTETGIWSVIYNAENRPVCFTNEESDMVVECQYDSMGRRGFKKVTINGSITLYQRYLYRDYLQIACIDLSRSHHPALWLITWDPLQNTATRPLAIQINGSWFTYGVDLTKNTCELYNSNGHISEAYEYLPFKRNINQESIKQPILWNSEYDDKETGLIYYNYRYYNGETSSWTSRDPLSTKNAQNLYTYAENNSIYKGDYIGLAIQIYSFYKDIIDYYTPIIKEYKKEISNIINHLNNMNDDKFENLRKTGKVSWNGYNGWFLSRKDMIKYLTYEYNNSSVYKLNNVNHPSNLFDILEKASDKSKERYDQIIFTGHGFVARNGKKGYASIVYFGGNKWSLYEDVKAKLKKMNVLLEACHIENNAFYKFSFSLGSKPKKSYKQNQLCELHFYPLRINRRYKQFHDRPPYKLMLRDKNRK